jgi:hypothetical protein
MLTANRLRRNLVHELRCSNRGTARMNESPGAEALRTGTVEVRTAVGGRSSGRNSRVSYASASGLLTHELWTRELIAR